MTWNEQLLAFHSIFGDCLSTCNMLSAIGPGIELVYVEAAGKLSIPSVQDYDVNSPERSRDSICGSICWEPVTEDPKNSTTHAEWK